MAREQEQPARLAGREGAQPFHRGAQAHGVYPAAPSRLPPLPGDGPRPRAQGEDTPWIESWLPLWSECRCSGLRRVPAEDLEPAKQAAPLRPRPAVEGLYPLNGLDSDGEEMGSDGMSPRAWALEFDLSRKRPFLAAPAPAAPRCPQAQQAAPLAGCMGPQQRLVAGAEAVPPSQRSVRDAKAVQPGPPEATAHGPSCGWSSPLGVPEEARLPAIGGDEPPEPASGDGGGGCGCGGAPEDPAAAPPSLPPPSPRAQALGNWPQRVAVASVAAASAGALAAAAVGAFPVAAAAGSLGFALGILSSVLGIRVGRWVG